MTRSIIFVCTGNICRSPLAEAILRHKINLLGRNQTFIISSAGTHDYHIGERPDPRTIKIASNNGVSTEGIRAKQLQMSDFEDFDLILGMDRGHVKRLKDLCPPEFLSKIHLFLEYAGKGANDVPDPYYGDFEGFEEVYAMCDEALDRIILK